MLSTLNNLIRPYLCEETFHCHYCERAAVPVNQFLFLATFFVAILHGELCLIVADLF